MINKIKEKAPSQFNSLPSHSNLINTLLFINLSKRKGCGRAEIRTRNFCVMDNCFAIKLLAHNTNHIILNYLKIPVQS